MFLRTKIPNVVVRRGQVAITPGGPESAFAAVMVHEAWELGATGVWRPSDAGPPAELSRALNAPLWNGTAATVSGVVSPPERGKRFRLVEWRVGETTHSLVARAQRSWVRLGGGLVPGPEQRWEDLTLSWTEAFGGSYSLQARKDPLSGLPSPAYRPAHPLNPLGKGFRLASDAQEGVALPRLELLQEQLSTPTALPTPGCFAPLPIVCAGMGAAPQAAADVLLGKDQLTDKSLAPHYLWQDWLKAGARLECHGLGPTLAACVQPPRSAIGWASRRRNARLGTRLRAAHLDAAARVFHQVFQHLVVAEGSVPDLRLDAT